MELTRVAGSTRSSLLAIGMVVTLAACGGPGPGGASTGPTGTGQASALASPSLPPTSVTLSEGPQGPLEGGSYVADSPFLVPVTFSLPAGWSADIGGPYAVFLDPTMSAVSNDDGLVQLVIFDEVYADPCHPEHGLLSPKPGPSAADLAKALASVQSLVATTPTDVTVAGTHGKQLTLTSPTKGGTCSVWQLPLGATNHMVPGQRDQYSILDVNGQRLVIDTRDVPGESATTKAAVQAILDSLRLAPA